MRQGIYFLLLVSLLFISCSSSKQIGKSAKRNVLNDPSLKTAHVGISVYDPSTKKYLYNYQSDKYFVPASNTKLPTCYAAMKYLGDSVTTFLYNIEGDEVHILPWGDPTFLHPDFKDQPAFGFLKKENKRVVIDISRWRDQPLGNGWSWNDYSDDYMAERSAMPMYGNVVRFSKPLHQLQVVPGYFSKNIIIDTAG